MIFHHTISIRWPLFSASRISQNVFFHLTDHQREDPPCLPKVIHYLSMPSLLIFISFLTLASSLGIFTQVFLATLKCFAQNWKQRTRWAEGNRMGSMRGTRCVLFWQNFTGLLFLLSHQLGGVPQATVTLAPGYVSGGWKPCCSQTFPSCSYTMREFHCEGLVSDQCFLKLKKKNMAELKW